jgi:hypothetical protein
MPRDAAMKTRFKMWYRLVGAAVEHAAKCAVSLDPDIDHLPEQTLDFGTLFLEQEGEDEDVTSLGEMLHALREMMASRDTVVGRRPQPFKATDVTDAINAADADAIIVKGFLFPTQPVGVAITAKAVGKRMKAYVGETVRYGSTVLVLKSAMDKHDKVIKFYVEAKTAS